MTHLNPNNKDGVRSAIPSPAKNNESQKLADEFITDFKRFTEIEGIIIRGHIVVERHLIKAIENSVPKPKEFKLEKNSFSNKLMLANMLGISDSFKKELNSLNKLRNQVAHSLRYDDKLTDLIINEVNKKNEQVIDKKERLECQLKNAIAFICGAISGSNLAVKMQEMKRDLT